MMACGKGFTVHSALYGDGVGRYADVTEIVRGWNGTWPDNWEELVYGAKGTQFSAVPVAGNTDDVRGDSGRSAANVAIPVLTIHSALYGIPDPAEVNVFAEPPLDVTEVLRRKVVNGSLDLSVTNAELEVGNPFRGFRKKLTVIYNYDNQPPSTITKDERDWLIIGQSARYVRQVATPVAPVSAAVVVSAPEGAKVADVKSSTAALSSQALNDYLIRKFQIPSHRLRGPMPIEVPSFHRNDLAKLFAELGMNHGCEVGVAEGKFSEVLCQAQPDLHLLCVDPWHAYSGNPQRKSKEKDEFAFREARRRLEPFPNVRLKMHLSMEFVVTVPEQSLDFVYIDGHHGFDYVMQDLIEWSKRVRSGGIVCGDDLLFLDEKRWGAGPIEAVEAYVKAHRIPLWFTFQGHKSCDFMWVKQ